MESKIFTEQRIIFFRVVVRFQIVNAAYFSVFIANTCTRVCEPGSRIRVFPKFDDFFDFPFPGFSNKNSLFCQLVSSWNSSKKQFAIIFV